MDADDLLPKCRGIVLASKSDMRKIFLKFSSNFTSMSQNKKLSSLLSFSFSFLLISYCHADDRNDFLGKVSCSDSRKDGSQDELKKFLNEIKVYNSKQKVTGTEKTHKNQPTKYSEEDVARYSNAANDLSQRAMMAVIERKDSRLNELFVKSDYFKNLDKLSEEELIEIQSTYSRKSTKDCYPFVKGSLSNDYEELASRLKQNKKYWNRGFLKANQNKIVSEKLNYMDKYWNDVSAKNAGKFLEQQGWKNLLDDPHWAKKIDGNTEKAPRNTVLVYSGGYRKYGHTAVKLTGEGRGGSGSDFFSVNSPAGNRKLIGVYFKPVGDDINSINLAEAGK